MKLRIAEFNHCVEFTDLALENFKGLELTETPFDRCEKLTDQGLAKFKGMPWTNIAFRDCPNITQESLDVLFKMTNKKQL